MSVTFVPQNSSGTRFWFLLKPKSAKRKGKMRNNKQNAIALSNGETMSKQIFGSSPDDGFLSPEGEKD
eukprot:12092483-Ditylum_brightwellii.AAC.1